jgi:3-hydroxyacyl-[acyl-carrier-protein] dehydratase
MEYSEDCIVAATHPALPGHFPGHPIVPGVVLLDHVLAALVRWQPTAVVSVLPQVKFIEPLLPEQPFTILLRRDRPGRLRFECLRAGRCIAGGILQLAADR